MSSWEMAQLCTEAPDLVQETNIGKHTVRPVPKDSSFSLGSGRWGNVCSQGLQRAMRPQHWGHGSWGGVRQDLRGELQEAGGSPQEVGDEPQEAGGGSLWGWQMDLRS